MPATPELDDAEKATLIALWKRTIAADPPSRCRPRIRTLRAIFAKLDPPPPRPQPYPPPNPRANPAQSGEDETPEEEADYGGLRII
jgi:hypothetical protein